MAQPIIRSGDLTSISGKLVKYEVGVRQCMNFFTLLKNKGENWSYSTFIESQIKNIYRDIESLKKSTDEGALN